MAEQLRGESRIPELLLNGRPERVPELVRMPALKAEAARHLIAYISSATRRKPVPDPADHPALEPDEEGGGGVSPRNQVLVDGSPSLGRDDHHAFLSALPHHDDLLALPVAAVKGERFRDPTTRREQEDDQSSVAQLRKGVVGQGVVEPDAGLLLDRLGQALGLLGQVDVGAEVPGGPFLTADEFEEALQAYQAALAGGRRQRPPPLIGSPLRLSGRASPT